MPKHQAVQQTHRTDQYVDAVDSVAVHRELRREWRRLQHPRVGGCAFGVGGRAVFLLGALHRGRASLRRQAAAGDSQPAPALPQEQAVLLGRYVALFNARDFDALRAMLAEDVRLELVGMTEKSGASDVGGYFTNYARVAGMRLEPGVVDGRPAILAREQPDERPAYCLFVRFRGEMIQFIRDYRYARHVFDESQWSPATGGR